MKANPDEKIRGAFKKNKENQIVGVAFDTTSKIPVVVRLLINEKEVEKQIADKQRKNSKKEFKHPTGLCGFKFEYKIKDSDKFAVVAGTKNRRLNRRNKKKSEDKEK